MESVVDIVAFLVVGELVMVGEIDVIDPDVASLGVARPDRTMVRRDRPAGKRRRPRLAQAPALLETSNLRPQGDVSAGRRLGETGRRC
jgi:hypothetical protein